MEQVLLEDYSLGSEWIPRLGKLDVKSVKGLELLQKKQFDVLKKEVSSAESIEVEALKRLCKIESRKDILNQAAEGIEKLKQDRE